MRRTVVWTEASLRDLRSIRSYIRQFNPGAAARLAERLLEAGDSLAENPARGRPVGNHRELTIIWPYVLRYRLTQNQVFIMRVRHGARQRP